MNRQVLCIWLPNWPCQRVAVDMLASTVQSKQAELVGQPFALQVHDLKRGLRIAAADPLARHARIMPGMSTSEALALLPTLKILPYEPEVDLQALSELTDAACEFSPLVGIELLDKHPWVGRHLADPQAIIADVTNLTHFFGGPDQMVQTVTDWIAQKGYLAVVAIAPSLGAAWAAANYGHHRDQVAAAMYQAALAAVKPERKTDEQSPETHSTPDHSHESSQGNTHDCILPASLIEPIVWNADHLLEHIDRLEISALRLDATTYKTLHRLGIYHVGSLRKLPRSGLAPRLGNQLLERLDSLCGSYQESIACYHAGPEFYVDLALEIPTNRRETIEELIRRLSVELCQRLQQHGQGALRVVCRLSTLENSMLQLKLGMYRPTSEANHLQRLLLGQFEQQVRTSITLSALSLQATIVGALRWEQTNLFEQAEVNLKSKTAELLDVLASRLGSDAVLCPVSKPDALPELARSYEALTGKQVHDKKASKRTSIESLASLEGPGIAPSPDDPLRRPLCLFAEPVQLDVLSVYPNGPPIRFRWSGQLEQVVRHWGPERIETHWWSGPTQRRDYYRVETQRGVWLWLFRDLRDHDWFLHGEFS